jgi:hypothetical protein
MSKLHVRLSLCVEYDEERTDESTLLDDLLVMVEGLRDAYSLAVSERIQDVTVFGHEVIS